MRPARLDPSALSPSEHEAYETWINELETYLGRLQRALRIGELLAFIRKRTIVDREAEVRQSQWHGCIALHAEMWPTIRLPPSLEMERSSKAWECRNFSLSCDWLVASYLSARLHPGPIASTSPTEVIQLSDYMLGMDVLTSEIRIASWHTLVLALP